MKNSMLYVRSTAVGMVLATGLCVTYIYTYEAKTSSNFITASSNFVAPENPDITELLAAARNGNIDGIKKALKVVDIDSQNSAGITALMRAAQNNEVEAVEFLLKKKANPAITDAQGMTALEWALYAHPATSKPVQRRIKHILELLLKAGAPKTKNAYKTAVKFGYPEEITSLLEVKQ